jgi:zinc and cadmium transporter
MILSILPVNLIYITICCLLSSILAMSAAYFIQTALLSKFVTPMVSLSIGFILGVCFLHALPEAFINKNEHEAHKLFLVFLSGIFTFFLLQKSQLLRHDHHHEHDGHHHEHGFDKNIAGKNGLSILIGDGLHNFCDGVIIAGAFIHSPGMGFIAAISIFAHEIPQEIGDFLVLLNAGFSKKRALLFNFFSGLMALLGGILGYYFLSTLQNYIDYIIVFSCSSLVYIAISDLLPQIQYHQSKIQYFTQMLFVALGLATIYAINILFHH